MLNAAECRLFIPRQKIALARQQLLAAWRSSSTSVEGPKGTATSPPVAQADRQRAEARPGVPPESAWTCPSSHPIKGNFTTSSGERCISHLPGGQFYGKTKPERCYAIAEEARRGRVWGQHDVEKSMRTRPHSFNRTEAIPLRLLHGREKGGRILTNLRR